MRPAVTLPLSLLAGIGVGLAFFRGPSALPPAASAALRESARPTESSAPSESPATTDAKTQRLLAAALRKGRDLLEYAAQRAAKMGTGVLRQRANAPLKPWMLSPILNELAGRDPALAVDLAVKSAAAGNTDIYGLKSAFYAFARRDPA